MSINKLRSAALATLLIAPMSWATITPFFQDFEALDQAAPGALGGDGWLVFANVFAADGTTFLYNYGVFPAPNGTPGFSGIDIGEGGPDQGAQQLVVYNDYNNGDHGDGSGNRIEAIVFKEFNVTADDVGQTFDFSYQAKIGNLEGASTAYAFIKTLDPNAGFATTNFITEDMTSIPSTWGGYSLSLTIDAGLVGQIFQVGFGNVASNFEGSGVFYDNVLLEVASDDMDGDGVSDNVDNCVTIANPDQRDSDGDCFGNRCDADLNNDGIVNPVDLGAFRVRFFTADADADFNGDGIVNPVDLGILRSLFFQPPGPNGPDSCPL